MERVEFDIDPGSTPEINDEPETEIEVTQPTTQTSFEELGIVDDEPEEAQPEAKAESENEVDEEESPKLDLSELSARSAPDGEEIEVKFNEVTTPLKEQGSFLFNAEK